MRRLTAALALGSVLTGALGAETVQDPFRPWTAQFVTEDKMVLVATVYPVPAPTAGKASAPAVLFVHGFGRDRSDWDGHGRALAKAGIFSMAFDLRGHGGSGVRRQRFHEETVSFDGLTELDEERMIRDLAQAVDFLRARAEIDPERIVLAGDGLGANLAIRHAAGDGRAAGLALLSPRWQARSIPIRDAVDAAFQRPTLVAGAAREPFADEVREIGTRAVGKDPASAFFLAEGLASGGIRLLAADAEGKESSDRILAWLLGVLGK